MKVSGQWWQHAMVYKWHPRAIPLTAAIVQTLISEELNHPGAFCPTPNATLWALFIGLHVCSSSCDFDIGQFPIELHIVELLNKSRSAKKRAPPNSRGEGLQWIYLFVWYHYLFQSSLLKSSLFLCDISVWYYTSFKPWNKKKIITKVKTCP